MSKINAFERLCLENLTVRDHLNVTGTSKFKGGMVVDTLSSTEPVVGTWIGTAGILPDIQYIQFQMHPDGSLQFSSTIDVGQPYSSSPFGGGLTLGQGYWKKTGANTYKTRQTQAIVDKDLNPGNNHQGIPTVRIVVDSTITMSPNKQLLNGSFVVNIYALTDIHLTTILATIPARPYTVAKLPKLE